MRFFRSTSTNDDIRFPVLLAGWVAVSLVAVGVGTVVSWFLLGY